MASDTETRLMNLRHLVAELVALRCILPCLSCTTVADIAGLSQINWSHNGSIKPQSS